MSNIRSDIVFLGLTRPTLFFGVTVEYFLLNTFTIIGLFIGIKQFKVLFVGLILHLIGYYICFNDPMLVSIYLIKYSKCNLAKNNKLGNSYLV